MENYAERLLMAYAQLCVARDTMLCFPPDRWRLLSRSTAPYRGA